MTWKHEIDLRGLWREAEGNERALPVLCGAISQSLGAIPSGLVIRGAREFVVEFDLMAKDPLTTFEEFNDLMSTLYDWADKERVWIRTTF